MKRKKLALISQKKMRQRKYYKMIKIDKKQKNQSNLPKR